MLQSSHLTDSFSVSAVRHRQVNNVERDRKESADRETAKTQILERIAERI